MIEGILVYLIKVSIGTSLMLLAYQLLFRAETHHRRNRVYLLSSMVIPTILPFININILSAGNPEILHVSEVKSMLVDIPVNINEGINVAVTSIGFVEVIAMLYLLGLIYRLVVLLVSWTRVKSITRQGRQMVKDGVSITVVNDHLPPFSFLNKIVIPENSFLGPDSKNILIHEQVHIKQKHFIDLIIYEVFLAFYWFNPFALLLGRFIRENHEFLADDRVSNECENVRSYQLSLLQVNEDGNSFVLTNNFNKRIIKKRIIMMNQPRTKPNARLKYLILVPLLGLLVALTITCSNDARLTFKQDENPLSAESTESILTSIKKSIKYPREVAMANYEDEIYLVLSVRNNKVISAVVYNDENDFSAPVVGDLSVVAYRNYDLKGDEISVDELTNSLETNCIRTANELPAFNIPESKKRNIEFAIKINFGLQRDYSREEIFVVVEQMPIFQGGDIRKFREWVQERVSYPDELRSRGVEGNVYVMFVVEPDGTIGNASVMRGLDPVLDKGTLDVVNSAPKWEPGLQKDVPVRVRMSIAIKYGNTK